MSNVGDQLRAAREACKLDIHRVAEATKIRTDYLTALESGDYRPFVAPVYIRGFVRTYAGLLKLDVAAIMAELDRELSRTEKFREPPSLTVRKRGSLDFVLLQLSKLNWRTTRVALIVIPALVVVIAIALAWRHFANADPMAGMKPPVYETTQSVSGDSLPLPAPSPRKQ